MSERTRPQASYGAVPADQNQQSGRDLRLDLFRGLALLFIFIDHIPNNVLSYITLHSIAFSDAAEVFVFISGYVAATVYGKALQRQGCIAATAPATMTAVTVSRGLRGRSATPRSWA